jgi:hypothetical protein
MRIAEHWIATTRLGERLLDPRRAGWLWKRLRHNFPDALSLVLMPDHLHLVTRPGTGPRLRRLLSAFTGLFGVRFDVRPVQPATTRDIAMRMARYGIFNPVEAGLVDDPWSWPWSTLRDLGGAAYPIWTTPAATAAAIGVTPKAVVSTLTTNADHRPTPPRRVPVAIASLEAVRAAVASTLRVPELEVLSTPLGRRLVVQASEAFAMPGTRRLASALACCERTIQRDRAPRHSALDAVLLCLGDERLRRGPDSVPPDSRCPR